MINIRDVISIAIFFIVVIVVLFLFKPLFTLKRDSVTGKPLDTVDGVKLLGWSILLTIMIALVYMVVVGISRRSNPMVL